MPQRANTPGRAYARLSAFAPQPAINRGAILSPPALEARLIIEVVHRLLFGGRRKRLEGRMMVHERADHLEIIFHIGPRVQQSARFEDSRGEVDKLIGEEPPPLVFR